MTEVNDGDTGLNAFGTPNYYTYDVGDINNPTQIIGSSDVSGRVGWVIRSYPNYKHDSEDAYLISPLEVKSRG